MDDFLTFYLFFRIWNSQFWRIRSGIRIWSLRKWIWLPKCLTFLFTIMKFKNSQTIRQNAAWSLPTFVFIQKQQFSWKKCHLFKNLPSVNFLFYLFILVTPFLYNVIIYYYLHHRCWFTTVKKSMSYMVSTTKRFHSFLTFTRQWGQHFFLFNQFRYLVITIKFSIGSFWINFQNPNLIMINVWSM